MDLTTTELYTIENGTKSLTEYVIPSVNKHCYEVKDGKEILYEGESYLLAKSLYQQAEQEKVQPAFLKPIEAPKVVYKAKEKTQSTISKPAETSRPAYQGQEITVRDDGLVNLTKAWKTASAPEEKHPKQWLELTSTIQLIKAVATDLKVEESDILATERGRYGGTFAHWQIFLAYAKYLSPEFRMWADQVVKKRFGRAADPDLN